MARAAMAWLIADLRRKIYDFEPETFESGVYYSGDTIRLSQQFGNMASAAATVANAAAKIWSPAGAVMVTAGTCAVSSATGMRYYDYLSSQAMSNGVWRVQFYGSVGTTIRRYSQDFEVKKTQRIWSDNELQIALDRNSVYVGLVNREQLKHNPDYTKYLSDYGDFESVTLYDATTSSANEITPTTSDLIKGIFTFSTAQNKKIYLEGESYNTYIAAAELLEELAADPNRSWQWSRGTISHTAIDPLSLAKRLRALHDSPKTVTLVRVY